MATPATDLQTQQRFAHLLDGEYTLLKRFIVLLQREQDLLLAADSDALLPLAQEKNDVYRLLQQHHDNRALLLGQCGLPNDDQSLKHVCSDNDTVLTRWTAIRELAQQAQTLNAQNGRLITEHMSQNQAALSVLMSAADQPQLYDNDGAARISGRGRTLGSA